MLGVPPIPSASVGGTPGVFMTVAGLVLIATALAGSCPLYALVGLDTRHTSS